MNPYLLPFEDFFTYLQQQGFALGVDDYLQVQALLNRLPEDCPPERLKRLLCPLVASSQDEQVLFYQAFDRYFADLALQQEREGQPKRSIVSDLESNPKSRPSEKEFFEREEINEEWSETTHRQKYGDQTVFTFWGFVMNHLAWIVAFVLLMLFLLFIGLGSVESPPKQQVHPYSQTTPQKETPIPQTPNSPYSVEKPLQIPPPPAIFSYWWLMWAILLGGSGFILYRTYRKEEEGFYLELNANLKPPKYWNIEVPKSELKFHRSSIFKQVSQQLQKRQKVPTSKLDVPKTLVATVEAAGYPSFHYLQQSELPEYLMLLPQNKLKTKDQKLQLFNSWYEALKAQEVFVHRFFYQTAQPEWCFDSEGKVFHIKELYAKFGHCRLLAFVDWEHSHMTQQHPPRPLQRGSFDVNSPFEGGQGNVNVFSDWQEKALLTTNPPSKAAQDWAEKNDVLLMPANLESMMELNRVFEGDAAIPDFRKASKANKEWENLSAVETVRELKQRLNKVSFTWLCATAMYPEMNWDLTVYIGEALFDERELVKEENVMPLVDLPWFRKGAMPDELRMGLMAQLDEHSQYLVRDALLHLLKLNPLVGEEYSADFFDYQLHIALEDAQLHPEDEYKLSSLKHLTQQTQFAESRYRQVVLRYLKKHDEEQEGKGTLFELGNAFAKKFKREDIAVEGLMTSRKTEKVTYVYQKAHVLGRLASLFVDVIFSVFFLFMAGCCFIILIQHEIAAIIAGGMALWIYLSMDSWTEGSGFGKYAVYRTVDVHTNKPCSVAQSAIRRSAPIAFAILMFLEVNIFGFDNITNSLSISIWLGVFYIGAFLLNPHGRKLTDYLAGTQVVYEEDYQAGKFEVVYSTSKKKAKENNGLFPRANAIKRLYALGVDIGITLVSGTLILGFVLVVNEIWNKGTVDWNLVFVFFSLLTSLFYCYLDNWNKGTGLGKTGIAVVVDLENLQLAAKWQKNLRRFFDLLSLFLAAGITHFLGFSSSIFFYIVSVIFTINIGLMSIGEGRRLGDYIVGTQVVNEEDFERKWVKAA